MKKHKGTKVAIALTIYGAPDFSTKGKRAIIRWLDRQRTTLLKKSDKLGRVFRARYLYEA
jgi:hypothetical protein